LIGSSARSSAENTILAGQEQGYAAVNEPSLAAPLPRQGPARRPHNLPPSLDDDTSSGSFYCARVELVETR
jgi:hypothetical protein